MKTREKQKHLITKVLLALIVTFGLFFALCDCAPKQQTQEQVIMFERN